MTRAAVCLGLFLAGSAPAADWQRDGLAWRVTLSDADVQELKRDAVAVARWVPEPSARVAITAAAEVLDLANDLGKRNGVEVSGVLGVPGAFVWPAAGTTPFVRLVAFQDEARQDLSVVAKKWDDLSRRVGGRVSAGWADAGRFVLLANPDGTVSLAGGGSGAARFKIARHADGSVSLWHPDGKPCACPPAVGPSVRGAAAKLADTAAGVARWTLRFGPDGTASLSAR